MEGINIDSAHTGRNLDAESLLIQLTPQNAWKIRIELLHLNRIEL